LPVISFGCFIFKISSIVGAMSARIPFLNFIFFFCHETIMKGTLFVV